MQFVSFFVDFFLNLFAWLTVNTNTNNINSATNSNTKKIRITCIGDSITAGGSCGATSYTVALQNILGDGYNITNCGASGMTMLKKGAYGKIASGNTIGGASWWSSWAYPVAFSSQPDIVTIMLGTNDAEAYNWEGVQQNLGDYYALDYVSLVKELRRLEPRPKIYILVPPPLYAPVLEMNATIINSIFPNLLRDIASVVSADVIDVYSALLNTESENTCDGCHPDQAGANVIARTIADVIQTNTTT